MGNSSNGFGFTTTLFLIFLVLKLTDYITWSWWWVTAPLWAFPFVVASCFGLVLIRLWMKENKR